MHKENNDDMDGKAPQEIGPRHTTPEGVRKVPAPSQGLPKRDISTQNVVAAERGRTARALDSVRGALRNLLRRSPEQTSTPPLPEVPVESSPSPIEKVSLTPHADRDLEKSILDRPKVSPQEMQEAIARTHASEGLNKRIGEQLAGVRERYAVAKQKRQGDFLLGKEVTQLEGIQKAAEVGDMSPAFAFLDGSIRAALADGTRTLEDPAVAENMKTLSLLDPDRATAISHDLAEGRVTDSAQRTEIAEIVRRGERPSHEGEAFNAIANAEEIIRRGLASSDTPEIQAELERRLANVTHARKEALRGNWRPTVDAGIEDLARRVRSGSLQRGSEELQQRVVFLGKLDPTALGRIQEKLRPPTKKSSLSGYRYQPPSQPATILHLPWPFYG